MSMSTALGLSSEFCGDEGVGLGRAFSVEVRCHCSCAAMQGKCRMQVECVITGVIGSVVLVVVVVLDGRVWRVEYCSPPRPTTPLARLTRPAPQTASSVIFAARGVSCGGGDVIG